MDKWLTDKNGEFWVNDEGKRIPKYCTKCGAKVGLYLRGELVFLCSENDRHYYGVMSFPE